MNKLPPFRFKIKGQEGYKTKEEIIAAIKAKRERDKK